MGRMDTDQEIKSGHWFWELLSKFAPKPEDGIPTGTPEEMISEAAKKTFWVSTTMSAAWGPAGLATILPEIVAVMRIQMTLVYRIAHYHGKESILNHQVILLVFANALGLTIGPQILRRIGTTLVIRTLGLPVISRIARMIGAEIAVKITQRIAGRWVPVLLAPVFGLLSRNMTIKIGGEADRLFGAEIVAEKSVAAVPPDWDPGDARG